MLSISSLLKLFLFWSLCFAMESNPGRSSVPDKLFGHFAQSQEKGRDVSVPFDKDMAYAVTWVPTRKLLMIYGFDTRTPKPFMTAHLDINGLQQKSYHQLRQEVFKGYSCDAISLPLDLGEPSPSQDHVLADFLEMQRLNPSYRPGLVPLYKILRGLTSVFGEESGSITLTAKPGDTLRIGSAGAVKLPD